jgi:hypothetical protein
MVDYSKRGSESEDIIEVYELPCTPDTTFDDWKKQRKSQVLIKGVNV